MTQFGKIRNISSPTHEDELEGTFKSDKKAAFPEDELSE